MTRSIFTYLFLGLAYFAFAQIPKLNSLPSAIPVLYLDFDGQRVSGTQWNTTYTNGAAILAAAPTLSNLQITEIHSRISEDYRPFDINVTTDSLVYKAAPTNKRCWIVFTTTTTWYPNSAGGVAYINVFASNSSTRKVGWVFPNKLNNSPTSIAVAGSHEAGHQFGLQHQSEYNANCELISEYHEGIGTGQESWGPIMGAPYAKNQTSWHSGKIKTSCSTIQNDLSVLTSTNNLRYRTDDCGNTLASATSLSLTNNAFTKQGLISTPSDIDVFSIVLAKTSAVSISAVPFNVGTANRGANLNIKLRVKDENNRTLYADSSRASLEATLKNMILQPGTYYFELDGDKSNYASDYGSIGSYTISGSLVSETTTGIERLEWESDLELYPNPAKSTTTLDLGPRFNAVESVEVFDLKGHIVLSHLTPVAQQITFDVSQLPKGMYVVRIITTHMAIQEPLIIE